jgi:hypothetical protein
VNRVRYVETSDSKIDKTPNKRKRITITGTKLDIELHRSLNSALIPKSSTSKKILDILFLGDRKTIRSGGNLNPKKVAKRTKISHKKLITKTDLNNSNLLGHGKLPFGMTLSIPIRSRLEGNRKTILTRRVTIRWTTLMSRKGRGNLIRRGRLIRRRGRRDIRGSLGNSRTPRIMKEKRRQRRGGWDVRRRRRGIR